MKTSLHGALATKEGVALRVWAPDAKRVDVIFERGTTRALERDDAGYFSGIARAQVGDRYRYRIDDQDPFPDPCSRSQPDGPHGASEVVDPNAYDWNDAGWAGIVMHGQVIYELHLGSFTKQGTFDAAIAELPALRELGITLIEIMPLAEFAGRWNWGYDGVSLWAPFHGYGPPDSFRRFVDEAHRLGLGVILDVVYNHLGPDGNYLAHYSPRYFTDRYENDWGQSINFDGDDAKPVREFFIENACMWVRDFHLDGLRLDATQNINDASPRHVIAELSERVRAVARPRSIVLVAENEPQRIELVHSVGRGGMGLDSMWNDDFHHSAMVALTGRREGYYLDYRGHAQEMVSAVKRGFLYQGQRYAWQKASRGTRVTDEPASAFVHFIQNHDQVGNTLFGERLDRTAAAGRLRAITALLLLGPETPMLFMGQEYGAQNPFHFFVDHNAELSKRVHEGRRQFLRQFKTYATASAQARVVDPADEAVFRSTQLDRSEARPEILALHQTLLALRRNDKVIAQQRRDRLDGAVLTDHAFVLRWFDDEHGDRLLVVNLDSDEAFRPAPEPLLAPPAEGAWQMAWSSDDPRFGGGGAADPCETDGWRLPGESATFFVPKKAKTDKERA